jgi:hypothetical protein
MPKLPGINHLRAVKALEKAGFLEATVCFRSMLNSVDAYGLLAMIDPIKDTPITYAQFAQSGKIIRHADQPPVNHHPRILGQPDDFTLDRRADGRIQIA